MKKSTVFFRIALLIVIATPIFFIGCQDEGVIETNDIEDLAEFSSEPIEGQYIVTMYGESSAKRTNQKYSQSEVSLKNEILSKFSNIQLAKESIIYTYGYSLNGFTAKLNDVQFQMLKSDSRVKYIEQDQMITLGKPSWAGGGGDDEVVPSQETPWGITRVNGGVDGTGKTAWIIDTGIDLDHPDLNVNVVDSKSFLGGKDADDSDDANGHGTHVAGTIAAIDNSEGVVGVAAGATVVSVRVLNRRGSGTYSGVIAGVDYVGREGNSGDVANMSLGGGASQAMDDAVIAASSGGVIFCLAAGNSSDDANNHSPARANGPNIVTVSASDINDVFAYFSNYGNPPIDWCAPGVSIKSTWKNGGYNTISGTSMATPHVAGVLLLGDGQKLMDVIDDPDDPNGNDPDAADDIITH
jgi:subtilisin family serine protease